MTVVDWDDSFSVGNAEIDADHQRIIALLNELHDACAAAAPQAIVLRLFATLDDAIGAHFRREEEILAENGYAEVEAQRVEHRLLRDSFATLRQHLPASDRPAAAERVRDFLLGWFMSHVLDEDMQFRSVFRPGIATS